MRYGSMLNYIAERTRHPALAARVFIFSVSSKGEVLADMSGMTWKTWGRSWAIRSSYERKIVQLTKSNAQDIGQLQHPSTYSNFFGGQCQPRQGYR